MEGRYMKSKMKKGNTGIVVLVMLLFVVVIAMSLYIVYSELYVKDNVGVSSGNQDNVQQKEVNEKFKINSLEEARELVEKYYYFALGRKDLPYGYEV